MVGEPCKLVFQNPFSQGKHKEVDGIIDCSNQCVIYDYSNLYNAYIDTCGNKKCEQEVDEYFLNSANGLTYYERSKESYPNNTFLHDGICHCGSEDCFNNQDSFYYFYIPTLETTGRGPEEGKFLETYPNLNCQEFNKLRMERGRKYYVNPCSPFNLINSTDRNLERDEFKFYFGDDYLHQLQVLYPNQSDSDAFHFFEMEKIADRPIRMNVPAISPSNFHCGLEDFIYSKNYSEGLADMVANFCDENWYSTLCSNATALTNTLASFETISGRIDTIQQNSQPINLSDTGFVEGTLLVNFRMIHTVGQSILTLLNGGGAILNWLTNSRSPIETHTFVENFFGYTYWEDIQNLIAGSHELGDLFYLTGDIQEKMPLHMDALSYMRTSPTDDTYKFFDVAPYQLRNWTTLGHSGCSGEESLDQYLLEDMSEYVQFYFNPIETFFEWFFPSEENIININGIMEWYHESTPYRTGKTSVGTVGVNYNEDELYKQIGPYQNVGQPTNPIIKYGEEGNYLNTVNLNEIYNYNSTLGALDIGERFKMLDHPYQRAQMKRSIGVKNYLDEYGISQYYLEEAEELLDDANIPDWLFSFDDLDPILQNLQVVASHNGPIYPSAPAEYYQSFTISDGFGGDCGETEHYDNQCIGMANNACDCSNIYAGDWQVYGHTQCGELHDEWFNWNPNPFDDCDFGYNWKCRCHCPSFPDGESVEMGGNCYHASYQCNEKCRNYCIDNDYMEALIDDECYMAPNNCGYSTLGGGTPRACSSISSEAICNEYSSPGQGCSGCRYMDPDELYHQECWTGPDSGGGSNQPICIHEGAANYNPKGNMGSSECQFFDEYPYDLYTTGIEAFKRMDVRIKVGSGFGDSTIKLKQKKSSFKWGGTVTNEVAVDEWSNEYHNTNENFDNIQNNWPAEEGSADSTWLDYFGQNTGDENIYFNSMTNTFVDKFKHSWLGAKPPGVYADGDVIFYNGWYPTNMRHMPMSEALNSGTCVDGMCMGGGNHGISCYDDKAADGSVRPADDMCVPETGKARKLFHYYQEKSDINYGGIFLNGVTQVGIPDVDEFKEQCFDYSIIDTPVWMGDKHILSKIISTIYTDNNVCEICTEANDYCEDDSAVTIDSLQLELEDPNVSFVCSIRELCELVDGAPAGRVDIYNPMLDLQQVNKLAEKAYYRYHTIFWDKEQMINLDGVFNYMTDFEAFLLLIRYAHDVIFLTGENVKEYDLINEYLPGSVGGWQGLSERFDNIVSSILDSNQNDINTPQQLADAVNNHRFFTFGQNGISEEPEPPEEDEINYTYGCVDDSSGINTDIYGDGLYQACNYNPNATKEGQSWNFKCHYAYNYPSRTCYYDADKNGSYETPIQVSMCPDMDCKTYSSFYPEFDYRDADDDLGIVNGCTDSMACNWNPIATDDDGSCDFGVDGYDNQGYHCGDLNVIKEFVRQNDQLGNARDYGTWVEVPGIVRTSTDRTDTQPIRRRLRLTELNLDNKTLIGVIPTIIGQAKRLNYLNLGRNGNIFGGNLTGPIPRSIGELRELTFLGLHGNHLTGQIPEEIGNLINLEELDLQGNPESGNPGLLEGEVPSSINNLRKLTRIELQRNQLGGSFPIIRNLTQLDFLQIAHNNFTNIDGAFHARNVTNIYAKDNNIMELNTISSGFERMSLQKLNLMHNSLRSLPEEFGNLTSLVELSLSSNRFPSIPRFISKLINLEVLQLSDNKIKTLSANVLSNLNNLRVLQLDANDITSISENFCEIRERNLPLLNTLYLGTNELCDKYYSGRGTDTEYFCISRNEFNMPFPQDQSNCCPGPNGEINYIECDETAVPLDYISEVTDTPRNEEYVVEGGYVPEFKFDASHFDDKKFFTLMLKMVVDISDYYRVNYWGGEPHRFYINEFHVINELMLDEDFPTGDNQIVNDHTSYTRLLNSLKPNSDNPGKRHKDLAVNSWYYYDRLGIGVQGHIWTNEMLKGGGFYNSGIPGEMRSTVIFDRFGSHIWRVLEKLAIASDRRLPIKITELDWFTENYCKRFENVGSIIEGVCGEPEMIYTDGIITDYQRFCKQGKLFDIDGNSIPCSNHSDCDDESTYFPSNFDENHPDYKFCKEMGELDANNGKGRRMFDEAHDNLPDGIVPFTWDDLNMDEAQCDSDSYRKYGKYHHTTMPSERKDEIYETVIVNGGQSEEGYCNFDTGICIGGPYGDVELFGNYNTYNGEPCTSHGFCNYRTEYRNTPEYEYLRNDEMYTGNWSTIQKIRTEQMINLYTKLYSHPQLIGVTNWGGIGNIFASDKFCTESVMKRYVKDYGLAGDKSSADSATPEVAVFEGLMTSKNGAVTGGTFIKDRDDNITPMEYMKNGHKEFIKQFDWIGEVADEYTPLTNDDWDTFGSVLTLDHLPDINRATIPGGYSLPLDVYNAEDLDLQIKLDGCGLWDGQWKLYFIDNNEDGNDYFLFDANLELEGAPSGDVTNCNWEIVGDLSSGNWNTSGNPLANYQFTVPYGEYEVYVNDELRGTINVPIEVSGVFNTDVWTHTSPWQGSDYNIENYIKVENMSDNVFTLDSVKTTNAGDRTMYFASGPDNNKGTTIYLNINNTETDIIEES